MAKNIEQLKIRRRASALVKKIIEAEVDLHQLQSICTHPEVKKEYKGDTGNYDPSQDRHWIKFHCPDCGKRWSEDQ